MEQDLKNNFKVTNMLGISFHSVQSTVTDNLSMCWITAKSVPLHLWTLKCVHKFMIKNKM